MTHGQLGLPSGVTFRQIASGWHFSCGITTEGTLACWGRNTYQQTTPPDGQFTAVAAGWDHACAIGPGGATCWGREVDGRAAVPPGVTFTAIGAGARTQLRPDDGRRLELLGQERQRTGRVAHGSLHGAGGRSRAYLRPAR